MSTVLHYAHLGFDADGTARIDGTRYNVIHLAGEHYHYGWSAEEILRQHPDLRPEQVYAALTYFYDHHESLVQQMQDTALAAEREAAKQPLSRAELLRRRAGPRRLIVPSSLYMDVHVPMAVTEALRRRRLDVLTSQDDGTDTLDDEPLLARAAELGRVLFSQDHYFLRIATEWQIQSRSFPGIVFAP